MNDLAINALLSEIVELHKSLESERAARINGIENKLKSMFEQKPPQTYTFDVQRGTDGLIKTITMRPSA